MTSLTPREIYTIVMAISCSALLLGAVMALAGIIRFTRDDPPRDDTSTSPSPRGSSGN